MSLAPRPFDRYTCEEAFRLMDDFVDRELDADERARVAEHLDGCAGCADMFRHEAEFLQHIREHLQHVRIPPELVTRVAQHLGRR
jgi:anti-sigma factor (TIGR02949 family)